MCACCVFGAVCGGGGGALTTSFVGELLQESALMEQHQCWDEGSPLRSSAAVLTLDHTCVNVAASSRAHWSGGGLQGAEKLLGRTKVIHK